jgi:hypothetical protein
MALLLLQTQFWHLGQNQYIHRHLLADGFLRCTPALDARQQAAR